MSEKIANNTTISTYHLASSPELYEPSRSNAFEFVASGLENLVPAGMSSENIDEDDYLQGAQDVIRLSVSTASIPHFTISPIEIRRGNSVTKFAGTPSFKEGSLTINDYVGARVKDILLAWQAKVYDVNKDVIHLASEYKKNCTLIEYTPDFSKVVRQWTLIGCWVSDLSESEFSQESNDKRTINVTIQYDRAVPQIVKD